MYTTTDTAQPGGFRTTLRRGEAWLDAKGKWAWIAVMVLGFIINPLVGLGILAYLIWGKQMFARSCGHRRNHDHNHNHAWGRHAMRAGQATGNRAFDDYKAQALRRLEEEQEVVRDLPAAPALVERQVGVRQLHGRTRPGDCRAGCG